MRSAVPLLLVSLTLMGACDRRASVVVFSPHGQAMLSAYEERFEAAYPQYDLQFLDLPSQEIPERLRAGGTEQNCDVWWGASAVTFAQAADEGLLEPYAPAWLDSIPAIARDPEARWVGMYETPEVIVFNSELVSREEAPRDWDDLLDPKWRGQILIRQPVGSDTMRTIFGALILREWPKTGSAEAGYEWLRRLDANTKDYTPTWDALLTALNRHEASLTVWNLPDVRRVVDERGYKLDYNWPASGTPVVVDAIALVKHAPNPEGGRLFYEFVNTPESHAFAAEKYYRIPIARPPGMVLPEWLRMLDFKRMEMDWQRFRAGTQEWMSYWSGNIRGQAAR
jgi:iron(III) transport system substrate-binding protein